MKKSILALVMALVLCFGIAPAGVMAAEYSGDAFTPAESSDQKDPVDVSDASVEDIAAPAEDVAPVDDAAPAEDAAPADDAAPAKDAAPAEDAAPVDDAAPIDDAAPVDDAAPADAAAPADDASSTHDAAFKPYIFEVDEKGEKAYVEMEPGLMDISSETVKTVPEEEESMPESSKQDVQEEENNASDNPKLRDKDIVLDTPVLNSVSFDLNTSTLRGEFNAGLIKSDFDVYVYTSRDLGDRSKGNITVNGQVFNKMAPFTVPPEKVTVVSFNDTSALFSFSVLVFDGVEEDTPQAGDTLYVSIEGFAVSESGIIQSGESNRVMTLVTQEDPPTVEKAVYNRNETAIVAFKTKDINSKNYELLGLVDEDPGGSGGTVTIDGQVFYVLGKKTLNRSEAHIGNETGPISRVTIDSTLEYNGASLPEIGSEMLFAVRTENSDFSYPIPAIVGCEVPVLESAAYNAGLNASVVFKTKDIKSDYFEIYGLKKDVNGSVVIANETYSEVGIQSCDRSDGDFFMNTTDEKGNPVSHVRISTPLYYYGGDPPANGAIVYFAVGTQNGRNAEKWFNDDWDADYSNLVETVAGPVNIGVNSSVKLNPESSTYNGSPIEPEVKIICNGRVLTRGVDYNVTFRNNIDVGTAVAAISGQGSYTGGINQTFPIAQKSLKKAEITLAGTKYTYNGTAQKPAVKSVKVDGRTLKEGTDFTVTYKNNVNAGNASVTIMGKGNYKDSATKNFTIEKGTPTIIAPNISKYAKKTDFTFALDAKTNGGKLSYSSSTKNVKVDASGKATVKAHFLGKAVITLTTAETKNYKSATKKMVITVKPSKIALVSVANYKETPAGSVKVKWNRTSITTATGYQVRYSTSKDFTAETTKRVTIVGRNKNNKVITGLKKNTTYYFQVRTYRKTSTGYYYSGWSNNCLSIKTLKK